ncbi:MAG: hypothetical protein IKZ53_09555 [Selenomonadaceae bacterium]|nr:hypothetical protein [Selenomonadaceae bacterium]
MTNKEKQDLEALNEEWKKVWIQVEKEVKAMKNSNPQLEEIFSTKDLYTMYCLKRGYYSGISEAQGMLEKFLDENK